MAGSAGPSAPDDNGGTTFQFSGMDNVSWQGVGVFLWKASGEADVAAKLQVAAADFSSVQRTGPDSFFARQKGVQGIGFADRSRGLVVLLTCGVDLCTKSEMVVRLTRVVQQRIVELWP